MALPTVKHPLTRPRRAQGGPTMLETLAGTGSLIRLGVRRDRLLLSLWVLAFAVMAGSSASAGAGLFPDMASRVEAARTINATASMVALFGRVYDPTSLGALSLIKYTAFMTACLAALMVFVMIRHTRADEESGRLELLSGAGVPDHHEDHECREAGSHERGVLDQGQGTQRSGVIDAPEQRHHGSGGIDGACRLDATGHVGEQAGSGRGAGTCHHGKREDPQ